MASHYSTPREPTGLHLVIALQDVTHFVLQLRHKWVPSGFVKENSLPHKNKSIFLLVANKGAPLQRLSQVNVAF